MGIAATEGQTASVGVAVVAVKARDFQKGDVVLCGGGIVRTVDNAIVVPDPADPEYRAADRVTVKWVGVQGAMCVMADELFWAQTSALR